MEYNHLERETALGRNKPVRIVHTPGEESEVAKRRENRLKALLPSSRFDR